MAMGAMCGAAAQKEGIKAEHNNVRVHATLLLHLVYQNVNCKLFQIDP